jgi:hypothetical protein
MDAGAKERKPGSCSTGLRVADPPPKNRRFSGVSATPAETKATNRNNERKGGYLPSCSHVGAPGKAKLFWGDYALVFRRSLPYQSSEYQ